MLVAATILSGLSIAVPALVMVFVYPVNRAEFVRIDGVRSGEVWPHLGYAILASLACGFASSLLATLSPVAAAQGGKAQHVKGSNPVAAGAHWIMLCAILALLASGAYQSNASLGLILVGLGLAGVAVAAWAVGASDPAVTQTWLPRFTLGTLVLTLLGNAYMWVLFAFLGFSG
jgi:hypothetical protein